MSITRLWITVWPALMIIFESNSINLLKRLTVSKRTFQSLLLSALRISLKSLSGSFKGVSSSFDRYSEVEFLWSRVLFGE
jgi:hypothetical protein